MTTQHTLSFRAEVIHDVALLISRVTALDKPGISTLTVSTDKGLATFTVRKDPRFPDVSVEVTSPFTETEFREMLSTQEDSHVMEQTLRPVPLSENSLERNWEL